MKRPDQSLLSDHQSRGALPAEQIIIGAVGPLGYSDHTIAPSRSGTVTVELAWTSPEGHLALFVRRPLLSSTQPAPMPSVSIANSPTGLRQELSIDAGRREPFEILVENHRGRTQAYVITLTMGERDQCS